jgi:hypothetical protein
MVLYAYVCVCAFSLYQESPNMILGDEPLISEVVLSQSLTLRCCSPVVGSVTPSAIVHCAKRVIVDSHLATTPTPSTPTLSCIRAPRSSKAALKSTPPPPPPWNTAARRTTWTVSPTAKEFARRLPHAAVVPEPMLGPRLIARLSASDRTTTGLLRVMMTMPCSCRGLGMG